MTKTLYSLEQRRRQIAWKHVSPDCHGARDPGSWSGIPCDFILPIEHADLNLWAPIRAELVEHFRSRNITWHGEEEDQYGFRAVPGPSPHLLDSQICALNFWWGLARDPTSLASTLRSVFPDAEAVTALDLGEPLVMPEWIGLRNYLGEVSWGRRGAYTTSADLLIVYVDRRGERHGVLVESKYTESYEPDKWQRFSGRGTDRAATYRAQFEQPDGPFRSGLDILVEDLLIEPFDPHLRQQLLARAMERARESGLRSVTCLHVAPHANHIFRTGVTAPKGAARGSSVGAAWRSILREPARYRSVTYEDLFAFVVGLREAALEDWIAYQRPRYPWEGP